jgi:hypothetical protein
MHYNANGMTTIPDAAEAPSPSRGPDWSKLVGDSIKQHGAWHTYNKLLEARRMYPSDVSLRGYCEIVRNTIVRELLEHPKALHAVPKLTAEFLTDFDKFNLTAQEGYLISLMDGRLDIQTLLRVSPFDHFSTLFYVAKLFESRAITIPA